MHDPMPGENWNWQAARATCLREAQRLLHDRDAAEDAAQEAVIRAWKARATCRGPDTQAAWLRAIAANEARRILTRPRRGPRMEAIDGHEFADPTAELEDDQVGQIAVQQALATLPARERQLMHLRYVAGLSQPQIAARLGLPEGTVKVSLHRSRGKLRTLF
jgi:RNA polymerase sigma-70 factor (ECF subfamily)